jgi:hypothetical protein
LVKNIFLETITGTWYLVMVPDPAVKIPDPAKRSGSGSPTLGSCKDQSMCLKPQKAALKRWGFRASYYGLEYVSQLFNQRSLRADRGI